MIKVNLGCGTNKLFGWQNYDAEIDIVKTLPFGDDTVDFMLAEHVVEHVTYQEAIHFLVESFRVLRSGGVLRIIVPSIERVMHRADDEYIRFVERWTPSPNVRGAMGAIIWAHGHKTAWTDTLMSTTLFYVGFEPLLCSPGYSQHEELRNVDGHWKVIGEHNNWVESSVFEGTKQGDNQHG